MKNLISAALSDHYRLFGDEDSDFGTFFSKDISLNSIIIDNSNFDDDNFNNCNPQTINPVRLMGYYSRFK